MFFFKKQSPILSSIQYVFLFLLLFYGYSSAQVKSEQPSTLMQQAKSWSHVNIVGNFNDTWHYWLGGFIRIADQTHPIQQRAIFGGVGFNLEKRDIIRLGYMYFVNVPDVGKLVRHENRSLQEFIHQLPPQENYNAFFRFRIEERQNTNALRWSIRLRLLIQAEWTMTTIFGAHPIFFNELFVNANNPEWTNPYFINQNRFFIGLTRAVTPSMTLSIGYLNQFIPRPVQGNDNHILFVLINIKSDNALLKLFD